MDLSRAHSDPTFSLDHEALHAARARVGEHLAPTPTRRWPLLEQAIGTETWVKHENHNPTGAFKVRGGVNLMARIAHEAGQGVISASRGNHSQSPAYAGAAFGVPVSIVVPAGNSPDKNAATEAYGANVIVHGADEARPVLAAAVETCERVGLVRPVFDAKPQTRDAIDSSISVVLLALGVA